MSVEDRLNSANEMLGGVTEHLNHVGPAGREQYVWQAVRCLADAVEQLQLAVREQQEEDSTQAKVFVVLEHEDTASVVGVHSTLEGAIQTAEAYVTARNQNPASIRRYTLDTDEAAAHGWCCAWSRGYDMVWIEAKELGA